MIAPLRLSHWTSFRGRYLVGAVSLSILLTAIAVGGWFYVRGITHVQLTRIEERTQAASAVDDLSDQVRELESRIQRYLIAPGASQEEAILQQIALENAAWSRLAATTWANQDQDIVQMLDSLRSDLAQLQQQVESLIKLRTNVQEWFPATKLVRDRMLPSAEAFFAAADNIAAAAGLVADPRVALQITRRLAQIRQSVDRMLCRFQGYLASRLGVTGAGDMRARGRDVELYAVEADRLLSDFATVIGAQQLEPMHSYALAKMESTLSQWRFGYGAVKEMVESDDWRSDIRVLQQRIDPVVRRIEQRLSEIALELGVGSARDITLWTQIARNLSTFVVIMAALGILAVVAAYAFFDRLMLRPVAQVTRALHAEANGSKQLTLPSTKIREMNELISAFSEMRRQVHSRQARLDHIAHHDPLTQLPNRTLFRDRLEHALAIAERNELLVGVMFLDLDRFKQINDSLGHETGDRLLLSASERLWEVMRTGDTVARLGGDEFAVIVEGIAHVDQVEAIARKVLTVFDTPFEINGRALHISSSVGIALCPLDERDADALIRDADLAMYGAKELGRNTYRFFSADMTSRMKRNLELETELREAVEDEEFKVFFQPIVELDSQRICGYEALLRWSRPDGTTISPSEFIPVLEETGLIVEVTRGVIKQIAKLNQRLVDHGVALEAISLNMTARLLHSAPFMEVLTATLNSSGLPAQALILEITEDILVQDFRSAEAALATLKQMGVRVALDDFGTGQSSLNHLRSFPIDLVKIDRDFVHKVPEDQYDSDLVRAMIAMGHSLGMVVVAEGVETAAQLAFLQQHGCHHVQGFLFGAPMSAESFLARLAQTSDPAPSP